LDFGLLLYWCKTVGFSNRMVELLNDYLYEFGMFISAFLGSAFMSFNDFSSQFDDMFRSNFAGKLMFYV